MIGEHFKEYSNEMLSKLGGKTHTNLMLMDSMNSVLVNLNNKFYFDIEKLILDNCEVGAIEYNTPKDWQVIDTNSTILHPLHQLFQFVSDFSKEYPEMDRKANRVAQGSRKGGRREEGGSEDFRVL